MDERERIHIRKAVTALDRVLRNDDGLTEVVRKQIAKRKARRKKRDEELAADLSAGDIDSGSKPS